MSVTAVESLGRPERFCGSEDLERRYHYYSKDELGAWLCYMYRYIMVYREVSTGRTDAVVHPGTMVVKPCNTTVARLAVFGTQWTTNLVSNNKKQTTHDHFYKITVCCVAPLSMLVALLSSSLLPGVFLSERRGMGEMYSLGRWCRRCGCGIVPFHTSPPWSAWIREEIDNGPIPIT